MSKGKGCTVFVGNIPYGSNEDDLRAIFGRVGVVESLRLVYDKDSKQPKGYGFCDYADAETAASAIRNLNDAEFAGRRLRIDLADNALRNREGDLGVSRPPDPPPPRLALPAPGGGGAGGGGGGGGGSCGGGSCGGGGSSMSAGVPPPASALPPGALPPFLAGDLVDSGPAPEQILAEVSPHTEIAQTVAAMPQAQLQLCLGTMQRLAVESPESARALLQEHPELCYALLHAQLLLGLSIEPRVPPGGDEARRLKAEAASRAYVAPVNPAMVMPPGGVGPVMQQQLMAMAGAFRGQHAAAQMAMGYTPGMVPGMGPGMLQQIVRPGGPYGLPPLPGMAPAIPAVPPPITPAMPPTAVGLAPKSSMPQMPPALPVAVRPVVPGVAPALPSL